MAAAAGERELFLGVDVGTQGTKGVLVAAEGPTRRVARGGGPPVAAAAGGLQVAAPDGGSPVVARAGRSYGLIEGLPPGAAEQHPEYWWRAVIEVVRELLGRTGVDPARVRGIGVSGQQHGLVVVDAKGQVLRAAKLWCDTSTAREAAELSERLGRAVPAGFTASKIVWLARHEPEAWRRTALVLLPHDFINFRLTGRAVMEAGDASGTGFFDPVTRAWDERAVTAVDAGLPSRLPPLLDAGEP
ncbi:MAG: FGGY family carbohydrate kinase, partial [Planctomycetota bacterium]